MPDRRNGGVGRHDTDARSQRDEIGGATDHMDDERLFRSATARTSPEEEKRLDAWLAASSENRHRAREIGAVLRLTAEADDQLSFGRAPTGAELVSRARREEESAGRRGRGWRVVLLAAAAMASVAVGVPLAQRWIVSDPPTALTAFSPGEFLTESQPATVGLADGSVVRLAPATRLRVHERRDAREVWLKGRGYFAVAKDATTTFTVLTDAGTVTVLGTRFDLSVNGEDLRLIVIEGWVQLTVRGTRVDVREGQIAQVLKGNLVPPMDVPDPAALIDWVGNFIVFQNTPLRTLAREIEMLHGVRLEFADPALGDRTVTALFAGRSFEEIAEVICVVTHLQCTRAGDVLRME